MGYSCRMATEPNQYTHDRKVASAKVALATRWDTDALPELKREWTRLKVLEVLEDLKRVGYVYEADVEEFKRALDGFPVSAQV